MLKPLKAPKVAVSQCVRRQLRLDTAAADSKERRFSETLWADGSQPSTVGFKRQHEDSTGILAGWKERVRDVVPCFSFHRSLSCQSGRFRSATG